MVRHHVLFDDWLDSRNHFLIDKAVERIHHTLRHLVAVVASRVKSLWLFLVAQFPAVAV